MILPRLHLLLATSNAGKLREIRAILSDVPVTFETLENHPGIPPPEETGATFADNARLKAGYYARVTGIPSVAEDSGLEIDALNGEPGVRSARYGGAAAESYAAKFDLIYRRLRERGLGTSSARFVCALAAADPERLLFETAGVVEGTIASEPRGWGGFGYDPIFYYSPYGRTLAELSADEKAAVSHRGQAFQALRQFLLETVDG